MKSHKTLLIIYFFSFISIKAQADTSIVPLSSIDSTINTDVKYASTNNFTNQILYPTDKVYIRKIVGEALADIQTHLLENLNLRIKIYDGYRPLSVQKKMWKIMPDDRYVANPATGSRHNRGAAVDLTLIDSTGTELDMGTEYDNFTERAHYDYPNIPDESKTNRKILRDVMIKFGFTPIESEWWHFDFKGWKMFSILDYQIN